MAIEIPEIVQRNDSWQRYGFVDPQAFPVEDWAPALVDIRAAETASQQRDALARAIILTAGQYYGLDPASRADRYKPYFPSTGIQTRVDIVGRTASLASIRIDGIQAGFHTPEKHPHAAYGVIDAPVEGIHHVIHDPEEPVTEVAVVMGIKTVRRLMNFLQSQTGSYHLEAELTDRGYPQPLT